MNKTLRIGLLFLAIASFRAQAKYLVCMATINSSQEGETFRAHLGEENFDYVELTNYSDTNSGQNGWFDLACDDPKLQCDVLVISGHFGGNFFGMRKLGLMLNDMDHNSCQHTCDGIVAHPKEVYLFGCNTLSGKNTEHRTPEQILATLLHDGNDRADAERNVAFMFSPFGATFRTRMEAIFEGVPRIYGFSAIAPSGASVRKSLQNYLNRIGDFKAHLDSLNENSSNSIWFDTMRAYNRAATRGMKPSDQEYSFKTNSCSVSDDARPLHERATLAFSLLAQDSNLYLPAVSRFINHEIGNMEKHSLSAEDLAATKTWLGEVQGREDIHKVFSDALASNWVTDSIRVDLLKSIHTIGWMNDSEFDAQLRKIFAANTAHATVTSSDFICSQKQEDPSLLRDMNLADAASYSFNDVSSFKMSSCLDVKDRAVTDRALNAFYENHARFRAGELEIVLAWLKTIPGFNEARASSVHAVNERAARAFHLRTHARIMRARGIRRAIHRAARAAHRRRH